MSHPFVDVQGLAGAWTLGTVQAGFELKHRVSLPGGFGDPAIDANRHLVGDGWAQETGDPVEAWTPQEGVAYICGTPPCSGFSLLNSAKGSNARGPESSINNCMKELVTYAGKCTGSDGRPGPQVVSFESVQGAYTQGRGLMQYLRELLEQTSGSHYDLSHVLMSGASVGNAQMRHRFYVVFHRIPFGVDQPEERKVVTYADAIDDLIGGKLQWEPQHYPSIAVSDYALPLRNGGLDGTFDAHVTIDHGRSASVIKEVWDVWKPGQSLPEALLEAGLRPPTLEKSFVENFEGTGKPGYKGWSWPVKVRPDRPGYVLTGGGIHGFVHWAEPRLLSARECSRLMGYPDAWTWPTNSVNQASAWIGKCCPVTSGRWISSFVRRALDGDPASPLEQIGSREFYYNCTLAYKKWPGGTVPKRVRSR